MNLRPVIMVPAGFGVNVLLNMFNIQKYLEEVRPPAHPTDP
jgi:hypothetical protein